MELEQSLSVSRRDATSPGDPELISLESSSPERRSSISAVSLAMSDHMDPDLSTLEFSERLIETMTTQAQGEPDSKLQVPIHFESEHDLSDDMLQPLTDFPSSPLSETTIGQKENQQTPGPPPGEESHPRYAKMHSKVLSWETTLVAWWQELLWCDLSIASVTVLAGVLYHFSDGPIPVWPLGLTLNTVIAFLATLARAAFIVPITESLSQLKWIWFCKERPLKDFQDFDNATRGPWGSIHLMKTTRGWSPSLISTAVLLTAVLTSTVTQSAVTYPTRLVSTSLSPKIFRGINFGQVADDYVCNKSISAGLNYDSTERFPIERPNCPTNECHWNDVNTLGVCVKLWNVTDLLTVTYQVKERNVSAPLLDAMLSDAYNNSAGGTGQDIFISLPNGVNTSFGQFDILLFSLNGTKGPSYNVLTDSTTPMSELFGFNMMYGTKNISLGFSQVRAFELMFYNCVHRYNITVTDNTTSSDLLGISSDVEVIPAPKWGDAGNWKFLKIPEDPEQGFLYEERDRITMQTSLSSALNGSYPSTNPTLNAAKLSPHRYLSAITLQGDGSLKDLQLMQDEDRNWAAIYNITNNIARSLTYSMFDPTAIVTGKGFATETYVLVRWPWLSLIVFQILLSMILLAIAITKTRAAGLGTIKSSTLPAFFAIRSHDKELLEKRLAAHWRQEVEDDMARDGPGAGWSLHLTERGWTLHR